MSKRKITLHCMKIAGYHNDRSTFTRLYIESRIKPELCHESFRLGLVMKANGIKCFCNECKLELGI